MVGKTMLLITGLLLQTTNEKIIVPDATMVHKEKFKIEYKNVFQNEIKNETIISAGYNVQHSSNKNDKRNIFFNEAIIPQNELRMRARRRS